MNRFDYCRRQLSTAFLVVALLLALPRDVVPRAGPGAPETGTAPATPGTVVRLASREVLINADGGSGGALEVQRLRFELPPTAEIPECCDGEVEGLLHVMVAMPPRPEGGEYRVNPYSMHPVREDSSAGGLISFDLIVKIYPGEGTSSYLGSVPVGGLVHVPQIRAADWKHESKKTAMVCFGVGVTGCFGLARELLERGGEVKMVLANRDEGSVIPIPELDALAEEHPEAFTLTHYLSRSGGTVRSGARNVITKHGRVDRRVLKEEFGSEADNYLIMGTSEMEWAVLESLVDVRTLRGHPKFLLLKGPYGNNSGWTNLSPGEVLTGQDDL